MICHYTSLVITGVFLIRAPVDAFELRKEFLILVGEARRMGLRVCLSVLHC